MVYTDILNCLLGFSNRVIIIIDSKLRQFIYKYMYIYVFIIIYILINVCIVAYTW